MAQRHKVWASRFGGKLTFVMRLVAVTRDHTVWWLWLDAVRNGRSGDGKRTGLMMS